MAKRPAPPKAPKPRPPPNGEATRFKPGTSGNPGGRPKWATELRAALEAEAPECARQLVQLAKEGNFDAIVKVLEYAIGKPKQALSFESEDGEDGSLTVHVVLEKAP